MLIRVIYNNGSHDMVKRWVLDRLLQEGKVKQFRRAGRWVAPGHDLMRREGERIYRGNERRRITQ